MSKKSFEWLRRARCTSFWAQFWGKYDVLGPICDKIFHLGCNNILDNIHYFHLCLLIMLYHYAKFAKRSFDRIPRKNKQALGPKFDKITHFGPLDKYFPKIGFHHFFTDTINNTTVLNYNVLLYLGTSNQFFVIEVKSLL